MLQVDKNRFVLHGRPIRLRGVGIGNWLNLEHFMLGIPGTQGEIFHTVRQTYGKERAARFWDRYLHLYLAEADLRYLQGLGLHVVRLPVSHALFESEKGFERSVAVTHLDRVISLCEALGLLAVIDLHTSPGGQNPDWHSDNVTGEARFWTERDHQQHVIDLWERIARRYRGSPAVAGYDLLNEPCYFDRALDEILVNVTRACIRAIRRVDKEHIIFVEGNTYARDFSMFQENEDENVAYTFHFYPFLQLPDRLDGPDAGKEIEAALERDVTLHHLEQRLRRPLWCGETGHPLHSPATLPALKIFLELLEGRNISWSLWPHKDARAMGLLHLAEESPWMTLVNRAAEGWCFWDIFSQDSILSVQGADDKSLFYKQLAAAATRAHGRFAVNLKQIPFDTLCEALDSFAFENCAPWKEMVALFRSITTQER